MHHTRRAVAALLCASTAAAAIIAHAHDTAGTDANPYLTTSGDPQDPLYANAGDNLRNGVGSIFIGFYGTAPGGFICSASAISERHVLTAAHCVTEPGDAVLEILFVLSAGQPSRVIIPASGFAVQPLYLITNPFLGAFAHGDVAVIELAEPIPAGVDTYPLYTDRDEFGKPARHYGHGRSGPGHRGSIGGASFEYGRTGLNTYEQVLEPFLGTGIRDQLLSDFDSGGRKHNAMEWWFTSSFVCSPQIGDNPPQAQDGQCTTFKDASFPDYKGYGVLEIGVAPGDSGGPAFIDGKIAGIHSFGFTHLCEGITNGTDFNCGLDSTYGEMSGDTRISSYATWITDVMGGGVPIVAVPEPAPPAEPDETQPALMSNARMRAFTQNVFARTLRLPVELH